MSKSRILTAVCLSIVMLITIACSELMRSDKPEISKWWLEPYVDRGHVVPANPPVDMAVLIRVVPGLDTDRILTLSDNAELGQFASTRWVGYIPELLTSLIERSLQATGQFVIVPESEASKPGNCLLELEVDKFYADIGQGGRTSGVSVSAQGVFQCGSATPVDIQSSVSIPVADERMSIIVDAFQQAMDKITQEILNKIYK